MSKKHSDDVKLLGTKSPGVERIEAIAKHITFWDRVGIFVGVFLIAYAYGLDGVLRYSYHVGFCHRYTSVPDANYK